MEAVLPDLTIRQLEYLVAVDRAPTWAQAAESLGVSPSALSQGLGELERRLGLSLFERQGRRRLLRPAAAPVLEHATRVTALTGDLARWAERYRSGTSGTIRLGMIDVAAVHHFPEELRRFREERPELDLRLRVAPSSELLRELGRGGLDLVVCVAPEVAPPGIVLSDLIEEELAIYRPDGRRAGPPHSWGPWVLFPAGSHTRAVVDRALAERGAQPVVVAESHQPEVLKEMVRLDIGWTVLPVAQAETGDRPLPRAQWLTTRRLVVARRDGVVPDAALLGLTAALSSI